MRIINISTAIILFSAFYAQAVTTSVTWEQDSRTAMTLRLEGTGVSDPLDPPIS